MSAQELISQLEAKKATQGKLNGYDTETLFLAYEQQAADEWQQTLDARALERDGSDDNHRYIAAYGGQA